MEEKLISFDTAKLAKEKGFDEVWCNYMYCIGYNTMEPDYDVIECDWRNNVKGQFHLALAPTQSLLQKWLREKHNIHVTIHNIDSRILNGEYMFIINYDFIMSFDKNLKPKQLFETYEEALEEGLMAGLNLIKT